MPSRSQTLPKVQHRGLRSVLPAPGRSVQNRYWVPLPITHEQASKTAFFAELKEKEVHMDKCSISFTLGKASDPHGANIAHNNRDFTARNVQQSRSGLNVTYMQQDVRDAFQQLFGQAVQEYNSRQRQPCRRISDYSLMGKLRLFLSAPE